MQFINISLPHNIIYEDISLQCPDIYLNAYMSNPLYIKIFII